MIKEIESAKELFIWPEQKPNIKPEINGWFTGASAQILHYFITGLEPRAIAELGSWTGMGSTRFLLEKAPNTHLFTFDHWSANVNDHGNGGTTKYEDNDPELLQLPKIWDSFIYNTWDHRDHLTPIRAKTGEGLDKIKPYNVPIDLIFIDADHSYNGVYNDIMKCIEIWPNAQIVGDDYTWKTVRQAVLDCAKKLNKNVMFLHNCWFFTNEIEFELK